MVDTRGRREQAPTWGPGAFVVQPGAKLALARLTLQTVVAREQQIGGSGGSLDPPGPLLTHLHTVYMAYSERLPTRLDPLAERTCFSQVWAEAAGQVFAESHPGLSVVAVRLG